MLDRTLLQEEEEILESLHKLFTLIQGRLELEDQRENKTFSFPFHLSLILSFYGF